MNLQILQKKTVFNDSTWAKRVIPRIFGGYSTSIHVCHIMYEVTIVEKTAIEAVEVQPHPSLNFFTGYLYAPTVYSPGGVSDTH
jgi:hypothetical protein